MVLMIGREFTRRSTEFLSCDKEYRAALKLGLATDTYDLEGQILSQSDLVPSLSQVERAIASFQGEVLQTPPMFSAKKIQGKKLYEYARRGVSVERQPVQVQLKTTLVRYAYPLLEIHVSCSKGTYIRSLASDLGQMLGCGAHLSSLTRIRSGPFLLEDCLPQARLTQPGFDPSPFLREAP